MAPILRTLAAGLIFATSGTVLAQNTSTCTCRHQGTDFQLGEEVCLNGPNGPSMARCEMLLNNTSWRFTSLPCTVTWSEKIQPPTESVSMNFEVTDSVGESAIGHSNVQSSSNTGKFKLNAGSPDY